MASVSARRHSAAAVDSGHFTLVARAFTVGAYGLVIATFGFQVVFIEGHSMEPTLGDHDHVIVEELTYAFRSPRPGDIVVLHYPPEPERLFVKRLIAVEGDTVAIADGRVAINGRLIDDAYVARECRDHRNWGPDRVPTGYDFVLGDDRLRSFDSRDWGMVPKRYIVGRVAIRYWPVVHIRVF